MMPRTFASVSLHTPPGRGGIAVISLTGPGAADILHAAFRPVASHADAPNGALQLGRLIDAGETIDEAIVCRAPGGIEVNIHGGPAVAARAMELFARLGAKVQPAPAASGGMFPIAHPEMNNPAIGMELLEAMPKVRSAKVLTAVAHQWSGGISALAEQVLDDGIGRGDPESFIAAADGFIAMRRLLEPAEVVLAGAPNAGKSTLANVLAGRQVSIVHASAGTTRDWVRQVVLLDDIPIHLTDTAGLWEPPAGTKGTKSPAGDIDAESVRRARMRACRADLVVLLEADHSFDAPAWLSKRGVLKAASKCDLRQPGRMYDVAISALTGEGMGELRRAILRRLGLDGFRPAIPRAFTDRQAQLLNEIARAIRRKDASAARSGCAELLGR